MYSSEPLLAISQYINMLQHALSTIDTVVIPTVEAVSGYPESTSAELPAIYIMPPDMRIAKSDVSLEEHEVLIEVDVSLFVVRQTDDDLRDANLASLLIRHLDENQLDHACIYPPQNIHAQPSIPNDKGQEQWLITFVQQLVMHRYPTQEATPQQIDVYFGDSSQSDADYEHIGEINA